MMPLYFMLLDAARFEAEIRPALAASWHARSFEPCRPLAQHIVQHARDLLHHEAASSEEPLLAKVARGLGFRRDLWAPVVGEVLLFGSAELPELAVTPETLCCLLAPTAYAMENLTRVQYPAILQAHFGTRDLAFGGKVYRPEHAGLNDRGDVARLADYLAAIDPQTWSRADLVSHRTCRDDDERDEELADARSWFPGLCDLYQRAKAHCHVVVTEVLNPGREL